MQYTRKEKRMQDMSENLEKPKEEIQDLSERLGIEAFPVDYWVVDYDEMNELASKSAFKERYPHWKWGMNYDRQFKKDKYGFGRIYELVGNDNPAPAYLQESNSLTDQKLVMAHVEAHSDFFKNNFWFKLYSDNEDLDAAGMMAENGRKVAEYMDDPDIDRDEVERWIDYIDSLDVNINQFEAFVDERREKEVEPDEVTLEDKLDQLEVDDYVKDMVLDEKPEEEDDEVRKIPEEPEKDLLGFLRDHGKQYDPDEGAVEMEDWQVDVLDRMREEAHYFAPQRMTKIMNEGWAAYWHDMMLSKERMAGDEGIIEYSETNAGVLGGKQQNPYSTGRAMWKYIENQENRYEVVEQLLKTEGIELDTFKADVDFQEVYEELEADEALTSINPENLETLAEMDEDGDQRIDSDTLAGALLYEEVKEEHDLDGIDLFELQQAYEEDTDLLQEAPEDEDGEVEDLGLSSSELDALRDLGEDELETLAEYGTDVLRTPWRVLSFEGLAERNYSLNRDENGGFLEDISKDDLEQKYGLRTPVTEYDTVEEALEEVDYTRAWREMRGIMESHNDATFIDTFMTQEFVDDQDMFTYEYLPDGQGNKVPVATGSDVEDVKKKMVFENTNFGKPTIKVHDANFTAPDYVELDGVKENAGGLLLGHQYNGVELDMQQTIHTMQRVHELWGRDVHLKTIQKEWDEEETARAVQKLQRKQQAKQQEKMHKANPNQVPPPPKEWLEVDIEFPEPEEYGMLITYDGENIIGNMLPDEMIEDIEAEDTDHSTIPDEWIKPGMD